MKGDTNLDGSSTWTTDSLGITYITDSRLRDGVWVNIKRGRDKGTTTWQAYRACEITPGKGCEIENPISQVYYDFADVRAFVERWICTRSPADDARLGLKR